MEYALRLDSGQVIVGPGWACVADVMKGFAAFGANRAYGALIQRRNKDSEWRDATHYSKEALVASSSKVKFTLDTLRKQALENIEERLRRAELLVASLDDEKAMEERVKQWRADQEAKISRVFAQLGEGGITDRQLQTFKLDEYPEVSTYERRDAERRVRELASQRDAIRTKSEAIVPDEDGNISLTRTQLAEFFGL